MGPNSMQRQIFAGFQLINEQHATGMNRQFLENHSTAKWTTVALSKFSSFQQEMIFPTLHMDSSQHGQMNRRSP